MKKHSYLLLIGSLIAGCASEHANDIGLSEVDNPHDGLWQDAPDVPFRFVLEQTWGVEEGPEEFMFNGIGALQIDSAGNIYHLDSRASKLSSFDALGNHRWSTGREGDGPGEFKQAYSMVLDGGEYLIVFNQLGHRIDRFDLDGSYIDSRLSVSLDQTMLGSIGMLNAATLVTSTPAIGFLGRNIVIISIESEWKVMTSFSIDQTGDLEFPAGVSLGPDVSILDGFIVNSHVSDYLFEFRDTTGTVRSRVSRDMKKLVRPGIQDGSSGSAIANFSTMNAPVRITDNYYLATGNWPVDRIDPDERLSRMMDRSSPLDPLEYESTIDLYDAQFELLYSWTTPDISHEDFRSIQGWDQAGKIYAVMKTDFPQIGRFRVVVTPPN